LFASHTAAEIVTGPNGVPPGGGSKIPLIANRLVTPLTNVTSTGEPIVRWCRFA
jgi:hypothetical protein